MQREMKLRCRVAPADATGRYQCTAQLFDGSTFTMSAFEYDVIRQGDHSQGQSHIDGWILVIQEAKQGNLVSITLPQPSDQHGYRVNVSEYELMPRNVTIDSFNPQK